MPPSVLIAATRPTPEPAPAGSRTASRTAIGNEAPIIRAAGSMSAAHACSSFVSRTHAGAGRSTITSTVSPARVWSAANSAAVARVRSTRNDASQLPRTMPTSTTASVSVYV